MERVTLAALNRTLLARQRLLEQSVAPPVRMVQSMGAVQSQYWPAVPVALWTRMRDVAADDVHELFATRKLLIGTLLRGTLHTVSAAEYPAYAAVSVATAGVDTDRSAALLAKLRTYAATPRTIEDIRAFADRWVDGHPDALDPKELARQRKSRWRPMRDAAALVRTPADGTWGATAPAAYQTAPREPAEDVARALASVIGYHLRAFGPATAADVATWIGWKTPPVRETLDGMASLVRLADPAGRTLYDVPDAPWPDAATPAPVRFLPRFDSVLLAYAAKHRARIIAEEHRDAVYQKGNLQILPTFLVDGFVAGIWSVEVKRRQATVTLQPFARLARKALTGLAQEAERLVGFLQPDAAGHNVVVST